MCDQPCFCRMCNVQGNLAKLEGNHRAKLPRIGQPRYSVNILPMKRVRTHRKPPACRLSLAQGCSAYESSTEVFLEFDFTKFKDVLSRGWQPTAKGEGGFLVSVATLTINQTVSSIMYQVRSLQSFTRTSIR
jgi:hypothetical protein